MSYNSVASEKPAEQAELLNNYFCLIFCSATPVQVSNIPIYDSLTDMEISKMEVSVDEVKECLSNLDTSKACGPDGIPARQLKKCCEQKASGLCTIF